MSRLLSVSLESPSRYCSLRTGMASSWGGDTATFITSSGGVGLSGGLAAVCKTGKVRWMGRECSSQVTTYPVSACTGRASPGGQDATSITSCGDVGVAGGLAAC